MESTARKVVGEVQSNFRVEKTMALDELDIFGVKLRHIPTDALVVHLAKKDKNCAFSVGFRTFPRDSSGVAHVLEHTALCGSAKYPVRDPFFKMTDRSLATYMNAWTAADWTMYPFSTQNASDYANLRDVYCDAVFNPQLSRMDFLQEGLSLIHI